MGLQTGALACGFQSWLEYYITPSIHAVHFCLLQCQGEKIEYPWDQVNTFNFTSYLNMVVDGTKYKETLLSTCGGCEMWWIGFTGLAFWTGSFCLQGEPKTTGLMDLHKSKNAMVNFIPLLTLQLNVKFNAYLTCLPS